MNQSQSNSVYKRDSIFSVVAFPSLINYLSDKLVYYNIIYLISNYICTRRN